MEALNICKTFLPMYRTTGCCNSSNQVLNVLNLSTELRLIKGKVCQTQLFISKLQRHVSAYLEAIIRLQIREV